MTNEAILEGVEFFSEQEVLSAMDAARKDEAIEFGEWILDSGWKFSHCDSSGGHVFLHKSKGMVPFKELKSDDYKTTKELYQLFKTQTNG